jgi:SAM-dependent methyltransferase
LAERIWEKEPWEIKYCHCRVCGFTYFNPQPDPEELKRYYFGYRSSEFQKMRQKHEPIYTEEFNSGFDSPKEIRLRKNLLREYLKLEINISDIKTVLDYGGDRGQFIIDELRNAKRYVYDISGATTEPGIEYLHSIEKCKEMRYDLIMCCHVLEHVPDPLRILRQIVDLADTNTIIYIELPYDGHFEDISSSMRLKVVLFGMKIVGPVIVDKVFRLLSVKIKMTEHINFFNGRSLQKMMEISNLNVLRLDVPSAMIGSSPTRILRCLARKK